METEHGAPFVPTWNEALVAIIIVRSTVHRVLLDEADRLAPSPFADEWMRLYTADRSAIARQHGPVVSLIVVCVRTAVEAVKHADDLTTDVKRPLIRDRL